MTEPVGTREITLTRVYDAPRAQVYAMWTEAEHIKAWWGPDGFSCGDVVSDPRPGGELTIVMIGPEFEETMQARYTEVVDGERITVESVVRSPDGQPFLESGHTVTFADAGSGTEVTVVARASVFAEAGLIALAGMRSGWSQSLQCLDDAVRGTTDRQIVVTRVFDAPPEAVFPLWTEVAHLERWWGPDGFSITVDTFDPTPGGEWRFTMHGPDGADYPNLIVFDEVVPASRLVYTHTNPEQPGDATFTGVVTFDEFDGKTALTLRNVFPTGAALEAAVEKYHAEEGALQTFGRLAEEVARVVSP